MIYCYTIWTVTYCDDWYDSTQATANTHIRLNTKINSIYIIIDQTDRSFYLALSTKIVPPSGNTQKSFSVNKALNMKYEHIIMIIHVALYLFFVIQITLMNSKMGKNE